MKNSRQKSIRLNNETIEKVQKLANKENRTFNNMVETILIRELEQCNIADVVGRSEQFSLADMKEAYEAGENNAGSYTYPPFEEWFSKR